MNAASKPYVHPLTKSTLPAPKRSARGTKAPVVYYTYDRHGDVVEVTDTLARQPSSGAVPEQAKQMVAARSGSRGGFNAAIASAGSRYPLGDLSAGTDGTSQFAIGMSERGGTCAHAFGTETI